MLGQRIALLRRQAGMSQAELAARMGVSASAVGMYEQGRREPSVEGLVALADILQVSTDYLLTGKITDPGQLQALAALLEEKVLDTERRLESRGRRPFTRQELAALFAAILLE